MPATSPSATATKTFPGRREDVAARAYQLWEQHGWPDGRDMEFWLEAERQLMGADSGMDNKASGNDRVTSAGENRSNTAPRIPRRQSRAVA